jgi:hypothetical protein
MLWGRFGNLSGIDITGGFDELNLDRESGKITVSSPRFFKIKGVGFEAGGQGGPIDICFRPDLTIIGAEINGERNLYIQRSETAVTYLYTKKEETIDEEVEAGKTAAEVLTAYHYDFELEPDARHPLFHAQYEPSSIQLGDLGQDYVILNPDSITASVPNHPRVPTAPLDFTGVLCMLVHEHRDSGSEWPGNVSTALERLPKLPPWCFEPSPQSGTAMLPEWWYIHAGDLQEVPEERFPPEVVL